MGDFNGQIGKQKREHIVGKHGFGNKSKDYSRPVGTLCYRKYIKHPKQFLQKETIKERNMDLFSRRYKTRLTILCQTMAKSLEMCLY